MTHEFPDIKSQIAIQAEDERKRKIGILWQFLCNMAAVLFLFGMLLASMYTPEIVAWWRS